MNKQLLTISLCALSTFSVLPAQGAETTESIQGYYRVQNVATGKYVEVTGPFSTAPSLTLDESLSNAGTVMRLRAFADEQGSRYKIGNLSCQGIEVFGTPQEDYYNTLLDLTGEINASDYVSAAYSLQRVGAQMGYIATGRMIVQALFQIVADRLDNEIANLSAETKQQLGITTAQPNMLRDFAIRFNKEVSANIDLHAYLEPVDASQNTYRLYFNWIDCKSVSEFYLANEQNKKEFEVGFACMRSYMKNKQGLGAGETIDANEAALWKQWGFDISQNYADCYDETTGIYTLTYEKIFADHELLYNWLKMYIERFLDPKKAPDAEILGINFRDFATEMQRHAIMQGFLKYIPSIKENQRLYLTSGRFSDGINAYSTVGTQSDNALRFGILAKEQALAAGDAAVWKLCPIKSDSENYFAVENPSGMRIGKMNQNDAGFVALYYDFPFTVLSDNVTIHALGTTAPTEHVQKTNLGDVDYVELGSRETDKTVARRTCVLLELPVSPKPDDLKVEINWENQDSDYDPEVNNRPGGFEVSDQEVGKQYAVRVRRKVNIETSSPAESSYHGTLLKAQVNNDTFKNMLNIDADMTTNGAYDLTTMKNALSTEQSSSNHSVYISTPWYTETNVVPANHSFILASKTDSQGNSRSAAGISLEAPEDVDVNILTGIENINNDLDNRHDNVIYDLQGRPVSSVHSGNIYILNGKKILVK